MEWQSEKRGTCKGCGLPMAETCGEDASERDYRAEDIECVGCRVLGRHRRALSEQDPDSTDGVHAYVIRREVGRG